LLLGIPAEPGNRQPNSLWPATGEWPHGPDERPLEFDYFHLDGTADI